MFSFVSECANVTGRWNCENLQDGNTVSQNEIVVYQDGCNGTTTSNGIEFTISGYEITFTGQQWIGQTAQLNQSTSEVESDFVKCTKVTGRKITIKISCFALICF